MRGMTAAVASLAAILFGLADFLGGFASKRESAFVVTLSAQAVGAALIALISLTVWRPSAVSSTALFAGLAAGVLGGSGVLALYAGLAAGRMSVVAPVTAALSGSLPALFGVVRGERLGLLGGVGIALALVAVVVVSFSAEDDPDLPPARARKALLLAVAAGTGFAGSIVAWSFTPPESGFAPLAISRSVMVVLLLVLLLARRQRLVPARTATSICVATGVVDSAANIAQVVAIRMGPLAVASVIGGLYPVATVLLARVFLGERLHGRQRLGVALALVAVVLAAWP